MELIFIWAKHMSIFKEWLNLFQTKFPSERAAVCSIWNPNSGTLVKSLKFSVSNTSLEEILNFRCIIFKMLLSRTLSPFLRSIFAHCNGLSYRFQCFWSSTVYLPQACMYIIIMTWFVKSLHFFEELIQKVSSFHITWVLPVSSRIWSLHYSSLQEYLYLSNWQ